MQATELDQSRQEQAHRYPMSSCPKRSPLSSTPPSARNLVSRPSMSLRSIPRHASSSTIGSEGLSIGSLQLASRVVFASLPLHLLFNLGGIVDGAALRPGRNGTEREIRFHFASVRATRSPPPRLALSATGGRGEAELSRAASSGSTEPGESLPEVGDRGAIHTWSPALSPDLQRVAVHREDEARDIWILVFDRGGKRRFTFHSRGLTVSSSLVPGRQPLSCSRTRDGRTGSNQKIGGGQARTRKRCCCQSDYRLQLTDWSPDGRHIIYNRETETTADVWTINLAGNRTRGRS